MIVKEIITDKVKDYRIQINGNPYGIKVRYDHKNGVINFINKEI